jgi:hypothetical protein
MKKKAEEVKGVDVAKIMKDTPVEKSDRFEIQINGVGLITSIDWKQILSLCAVEFDLVEESIDETTIKVRFIGVKAYSILREALKCIFNIALTLYAADGEILHQLEYKSLELEEVYGLQLSNLSEPQVPNFIARFHKRKREEKEHTGWSKRL